MNLLKTACVVSVLSLALSACGDKAEKKVEAAPAQDTTQSQTMPENNAAAPAPATEEAAPAQDNTDASAQQPASDAAAPADAKSE